MRNCATKATPADHAEVEPRLRDGFLRLSRAFSHQRACRSRGRDCDRGGTIGAYARARCTRLLIRPARAPARRTPYPLELTSQCHARLRAFTTLLAMSVKAAHLRSEENKE